MDAKRATLRDVAAAAGVSRALAGFVLGDDHGKSIPEATRERVREAARSLGYVPHGIARALREGSSRVVVLIIDPSLESNYSRTFARGLNDELAAYGHLLLVLHEHSAPVPERQILDTISPRAVIRLPGNYLRPGHELDDGGWEGGFAANILVQVRYLADRGHATIAVALPGGDPPLGPVRVRFAREAAVRVGLDEPAVLIVPRSRPAAVQAVGEFRAAHAAVTAVAAFDDDVALRVLAAMRALGLAAPADLAVIGFDDTDYGALVDPALTTVHVDAEEHGRKAAREVLGLDPGPLARFTPGRVMERQRRCAMAGAAARQRQAYEAMLNDDAGPFITGVSVLFSPAGAAQDEANPKGGYGRFAQILLPMEYGTWAQEAQAHVRSAYLGDWTSLSTLGSSAKVLSIRSAQASWPLGL